MEFPPHEQKGDQYAIGAQILIDISSEFGVDIDPLTAESWKVTMSRLAEFDELAEQDPDNISPVDVLDFLGLDQSQTELLVAADSLLGANMVSLNADSMRQRVLGRVCEAKHVCDILRFQSPPDIANNNKLWEQIDVVSIAGIMLDDIMDSIDDSSELEGISVADIITGSLRELSALMKCADMTTWRSLLSASNRYGLSRHVATKPIRIAKDLISR